MKYYYYNLYKWFNEILFILAFTWLKIISRCLVVGEFENKPNEIKQKATKRIKVRNSMWDEDRMSDSEEINSKCVYMYSWTYKIWVTRQITLFYVHIYIYTHTYVYIFFPFNNIHKSSKHLLINILSPHYAITLDPLPIIFAFIYFF